MEGNLIALFKQCGPDSFDEKDQKTGEKTGKTVEDDKVFFARYLAFW